MENHNDLREYEYLNTRFHIDSLTIFEWYRFKKLGIALGVWNNPPKKLYNICVAGILYVFREVIYPDEN